MIKCKPDHKFLVVKSEYIKASDLTVGAKLLFDDVVHTVVRVDKSEEEDDDYCIEIELQDRDDTESDQDDTDSD